MFNQSKIPVDLIRKKVGKNNNNQEIMKKKDFSQEPVKFRTNFVLQNELTLQTQVISFQVFFQNQQADLFPLFSHVLSQTKNLSFKIYDFEINKSVQILPTTHKFCVPSRIINNLHHLVLIKYTINQSETFSEKSSQNYIPRQTNLQISSKKSQRSKQRRILDVIKIVKKWRNLHQNKNGPKLSLPQAAKTLGLPKKSLDDYFYQLRLGQKFGFDFHGHILDGIGVLRSFLKQFNTHRKNQRNQKIESVLRISNEIQKYENLQKNGLESLDISKESKMDEQRQGIQECGKRDSQYIQQSFYDEFNIDFNRQIDPFVHLQNGPRKKCEMVFGNDLDFFQE